MAKDLTGTITTEIATDEHRPIELYIVFLDDLTIYLTDHDQDIAFFDLDDAAQTYTAAAIGRGEVRTNIDNRIDSVTVQLDNINRAMTDYIASYEFRGRRMIIRRVYEDYLSDADDYITVFDGLMDNPVISEQSMQVTLKSRLGTLTKRIPRRMYQIHCNWEFGSTECGIDKTATDIVDATVIAGSTTSIIRISGSTYENLADDYYKYGSVEVTAGDNDKESRLLTYSSGTFAVTGISGVQVGLGYNLSYSPIGDTVTIQQGCDKTPTFCDEQYSNLVNYGGFDTIPQNLYRR